MALITEDGTGVDDANGFITVAFADTYFGDRGNDSWTGDETAKEQAIIRATDYMEIRYRDRWLGRLSADATTLSWPRVYLTDRKGNSVDGTIPLDIQKACAEYALRALTAALLPDPVVADASGRAVTRSVRKVGPIETETEFLAGFQKVLRKYPVPDMFVNGWISPSTGGVIR